MRKMALLVLVLFVFLPLSSSRAAEPLHFASVSVDIWPEYDQAAVLVIERMTLPADASLPPSLEVKIPSGGQINAVAAVDANGQLVNAPYESKVQGDWSLITIAPMNSKNVQVEYYQALSKSGTTRNILFQWSSAAPVDAFQVNFLAPAGSTGITLEPAAESTTSGQEGLTNYVIRSQNIAAGKVFEVKIRYDRQTDELGIANQPVQAVTQPGADTPGRVTFSIEWAWILGGIGLVLVAGGLFGVLRWKRAEQLASLKLRSRQPARGAADSEAVYCHECGKRAEPGDIFCRTCGTRLKKSEP